MDSLIHESLLDKGLWESLNLTSAKNIKQHWYGQDGVGEGGDACMDGPACDGGDGQDVPKVVDGYDAVLCGEGAGGGGGATQPQDADGQLRQGGGN